MYVPHWANSGLTVHVKCRENYSFQLRSISPPGGAFLMTLEPSYGVNFQPEQPVILKFRECQVLLRKLRHLLAWAYCKAWLT